MLLVSIILSPLVVEFSLNFLIPNPLLLLSIFAGSLRFQFFQTFSLFSEKFHCQHFSEKFHRQRLDVSFIVGAAGPP